MNKEEFREVVEKCRELIKSREYAKCTCPKVKCEWHGKCYECVLIHRVNSNHVPNCMQHIFEEKVRALAGAIEFNIEKKPMTPPEFWDYVNEVSPPRDDNGETT